jgi:hypothetical protein
VATSVGSVEIATPSARNDIGDIIRLNSTLKGRGYMFEVLAIMAAPKAVMI